jgi:hypothetical protein
MNKIFEKYFTEVLGCTFVTDFASVEKLIKKEHEFEIFKDCKEAQWEKTLEIFKKAGKGYFIFSNTEIDFDIQGEGWYYLNISTDAFSIQIVNQQKFYWYCKKTDLEVEKNINKTNAMAMFGYLRKQQS